MLYGSLIRAVQQRVPLPYTFKLIDECLLLDSPETFLQKYISAIQGKRFHADAHAKIIAYLERKGFVFAKNDPFLLLEYDGEYPGDLNQHRFFEFHDRKVIHVASTGNMVSSGSTGFFLWEGSVAFLAHLLEIEDFRLRFKGRRVLELGSGAGLAGISVASVAEPAEVLLTDVERVHDTFTAVNISCNPSAAALLSSCPLDWEDGDRLAELRSYFEVVIGCDLVYDPVVCQVLAAACRQLLLPGTVQEILLLCTLRNPTTFETFVRDAREFANVSIASISFSSAAKEIIVTDPTSLRLLSLKPIN